LFVIVLTLFQRGGEHCKQPEQQQQQSERQQPQLCPPAEQQSQHESEHRQPGQNNITRLKGQLTEYFYEKKSHFIR
jgi:hypothetical protein